MPKYRMKIRGGYGKTPDGVVTEWDLPLDELEIGDDFTLPAPNDPGKVWELRVITIIEDEHGEYRDVIVDKKP